MREIKFRAWTLRTMLYNVPSNMIECELMQYTGLKDKNLEKQNEVYESDIIEFINGNKAVIEWDNYTGGWVARSIHKSMMKWNLVDSLLESALVIGNIYENSELLEKQND